jgi:hypothetical protein
MYLKNSFEFQSTDLKFNEFVFPESPTASNLNLKFPSWFNSIHN